ncbi:MAG: hypothetical protein DRP51_10595 [Candidatus Zixiibacteriota bacterium]|nr:MAG: hypothetical protein DRP51_10595 [candidate division Zixibacteria bacterium]
MRKNYFITALIMFSLILFLLPELSSGQSKTTAVQSKISSIGKIPKVGWISYIDYAKGHLGIISEDQKQFQLLSENKAVGFELNSQTNRRFCSVSMSQNPDVILIGSCLGEQNYSYSSYDYTGQCIFNSLNSRNALKASHSGSYYYSISDYGFNNRQPQIFDKNGNLLVTYQTKSPNWEMVSANDSLLVFQDGVNIRLISVPDLVVKKEIVITEDIKSPSRLVTSVSLDASTYAFSSDAKIVIVNLKNGNVGFVSKDGNEIPLGVDILLSDDGKHLVTYRSSSKGKKIDVYERNAHDYQKIVKDYYVKDLDINFMSLNALFLGKNNFVISFVYNHGEYQYKSLMFEIVNNDLIPISDVPLSGFVTIDSYDSKSVNQFRLNSHENQIGQTVIYTIKRNMELDSE